MKRFFALLALLCLLFSAAPADGMIPVVLSPDLTPEASDGYTFQDGVLTFVRPGDYLLSGSLDQGQIRVDCPDDGKVTLYMNGVSVHNENGPALFIGEVSPRLVISLVEGTSNTLSDGKSMPQGEEDPDGVVYSMSDLTIEGSGKLAVEAGAMNGIVSRDDIRITGGILDIDVPLHGIKGKDSVEISGGDIVIRADRDGIKSTNKKDPDRGYIEISGGKISITCRDDALSFITACRITGGELFVTMDN